MGQKRSDFETGPLCHPHHEEQHRIGWPRFIQTYELDVPAILAELREKPRLVIIDTAGIGMRRWHAFYRDQWFVLELVAYGARTSVKLALRVCGEYLRDQLLERSKVA